MLLSSKNPHMKSFFRTRVSKQLRGFSAAACLLAVSTQLVLPVLHAVHIELPSSASAAADVVRSPDAAAQTPADHEAATCAQCRIVSQLKSLTPPAALLLVASVSEAWIADAHCGHFGPGLTLHQASPRAPPFPS